MGWNHQPVIAFQWSKDYSEVLSCIIISSMIILCIYTLGFQTPGEEVFWTPKTYLKQNTEAQEVYLED